MTPKLLITRLRRAATVTSAGMSVLLLEAPWLGFTASGEIRPTLINPTSQVGTPTVSPVGGASIEPVLIVSVAQVGAPAVSPAVATTISPTLIASTAQVGAPMTAPAGVVAIVPALVASAALVGMPTISPATAPSLAPASISSAAFVGAPTLVAASVAVSASQMWSSTDKGPNYTLSDRNLVSTYTSGSGDQITRAATPGTGKFYFEVTAINLGSPVNMPIGLADSFVATTTFLGGTTRSVALVPTTGKLIYDNKITGIVYGTFTTGDIIGIAVDRTLSPPVVYFSKNGVWLAPFNPAAGAGGFALPNMTDFIPAFSTNRIGASARLNTGPATLYAPPTGFSTLVAALPA
jgi:hypothetical protein